MAISGYDTTAANNTLTPPNGAPEGMAPSAVNNIQRQQMANDRAQWNTAEWFEYLDGTPNGTVAYVANNQFKITGQDATAYYHVGRKLKLVDAVPLTTYTSITASSYGSGATLITVSSTALTNVAITAYASIISAINSPIPATASPGIDDQATTTQLTITDTTSTFNGTITGNGSGLTDVPLATLATTATLATSASAVAVLAESTNTTCSINFTTAVSGDLPLKTNTALLFNSNTGVVTSTDYTVTSDQRLKNNIVDMPLDWDRFNQYRAVLHEWNDPNKTGVFPGMIAQEVQKINPSLIEENKDNGMLSLNYAKLVPELIQTIQDLNARVKMLEAK